MTQAPGLVDNKALRELLDAAAKPFRELNRDALLKSLLQRENTMTTYLGYGVALPHVRARMNRRYLLAVGRSATGIRMSHRGVQV